MLICTNVKTEPVHDMYCMKRDTQPPQTCPLINYKRWPLYNQYLLRPYFDNTLTLKQTQFVIYLYAF